MSALDPQNKRIIITVPNSEYGRIQRWAEEQHLSVPDLCRLLIRSTLEERERRPKSA